MVSIDIPQFTEHIKSEVTWQTSDRNTITVYKTNGFRIVLMALRKHAFMQEDVTDGIISLHILEGEINFRTDHESIIVKAGETIALHKGINHSVEAM